MAWLAWACAVLSVCRACAVARDEDLLRSRLRLGDFRLVGVKCIRVVALIGPELIPGLRVLLRLSQLRQPRAHDDGVLCLGLPSFNYFSHRTLLSFIQC